MKLLLVVAALLAIVPASATISPDTIPKGDPGLIKPDHPLYFLDDLFDELNIKFHEVLRALRIISDDSFSKLLLDIAAERKAELNYLDQKGRTETKIYKNVNESMHKWLYRYDEYTKPKLEISYEIDGYEVNLLVKNIWDRKIDYVTGGYEARNVETGKTVSMKSPLAYPLNLNKGEERAYKITIPAEYAGTWIVSVEVYTWDGQKLIKDSFEVKIPGGIV